MIPKAMTFVSIQKFLKLAENGQNCWKCACEMAFNVTSGLFENKFSDEFLGSIKTIYHHSLKWNQSVSKFYALGFTMIVSLLNKAMFILYSSWTLKSAFHAVIVSTTA